MLLEGRLDVSGLPVKPALRYFLVRHGDRVLGPHLFPRLGSWYELDHRTYDASVYVADRGRHRPARHLQLVARAAYTDGWGPHVLKVWTGPGRQWSRLSAKNFHTSSLASSWDGLRLGYGGLAPGQP